MFFKLSAPHVSFREYMYEGNLITKPLVLLIACVVKLFRIPIAGSTDIPPVRSLAGFRVGSEKMNPEILNAITDMDLQLHELGFTRIDLIDINDLQNKTHYGGAVYRSADGDTVAWIRYRVWPNLERHNKYARLALYSLGPSGEIILTTAATRDLLDPPDWNTEYRPKTDAGSLCDFHQNHLRRVLGNARPMIAKDVESAFDLLEHTHEEFVAFQLERGVFVETKQVPTPTNGSMPDAAAAAPSSPALDATTAELILEDPIDGVVDVDVDVDEMQPIIDAVRKQETKQSGWLTKLLILGVSIAFFILLGWLQWELELVLFLVPILLVHELGHYVAMKAFGYKNIHMFFIPLLGAAVSGRNYRVSGWKKSMVSLAGPLPSIALGLVLGGVGYWFDNEWCLKGSIITLLLNVLNLAPFLPLDGGQVAHITLFSRSDVMDLLFRIGTIALLLVVAALLQVKFLFGLGIAMTLGLPTVWRTMKVTESARNRELPEPTDDAMPVEAIGAVVDAIRQSNLPTQDTTTLAKLTLSVYENVIIRPPGWPATVGIWALYFGGLFTGVIGMIAVAVAIGGSGAFDFIPEFDTHYERIDLDDGEFRLGKSVKEPPRPKLDLLAWRFPNPQAASAAFVTLRETTEDSVSRLGNVVFTSQIARPANVDEFAEDFQARMQAVERLANDDPRLDLFANAQWRRAFNESPPQLVVVVDPDQVDEILDACEQRPAVIGDYAPIAPWTPKVELSQTQAELQQKLRVLQGATQETPWETVRKEPRRDDASETSQADLRESMRQSAQRMEQTRQNRSDWIKRQADTTVGDSKRLYSAYSEHEIELENWREDERPFEKKGQPSNLARHLAPLLPALGYLHRDHPLLATSVTIEAIELDLDAEDDALTEAFPLEVDGRSVVFLYLTPTQDAAAALDCVHAWLKTYDVRSVVWNYNSIAETE